MVKFVERSSKAVGVRIMEGRKILLQTYPSERK